MNNRGQKYTSYRQAKADHHAEVADDGDEMTYTRNRRRRLGRYAVKDNAPNEHFPTDGSKTNNAFDRRAQTLLRFRAIVSSGTKTYSNQQQNFRSKKHQTQNMGETSSGRKHQTLPVPESEGSVPAQPTTGSTEPVDLFEHAFQCLDRLESALKSYTSAQIIESSAWSNQYVQFRKFGLGLIISNPIKAMHCKIWLRIWQVMVQQYLSILVEYQHRKAVKGKDKQPEWQSSVEDRRRFESFFSDWMHCIHELRLRLNHNPLSVLPLHFVQSRPAASINASRDSYSRRRRETATDLNDPRRDPSAAAEFDADESSAWRAMLPPAFTEYGQNSISDITDAWRISVLVLDIDLAKSMRKLIQVKNRFLASSNDEKDLELLKADIVRCKARMSALKLHLPSSSTNGEELYEACLQNMAKHQQLNAVSVPQQQIDLSLPKTIPGPPVQHHVLLDAPSASTRTQFLSRFMSSDLSTSPSYQQQQRQEPELFTFEAEQQQQYQRATSARVPSYFDPYGHSAFGTSFGVVDHTTTPTNLNNNSSSIATHFFAGSPPANSSIWSTEQQPPLYAGDSRSILPESEHEQHPFGSGWPVNTLFGTSPFSPSYQSNAAATSNVVDEPPQHFLSAYINNLSIGEAPTTNPTTTSMLTSQQLRNSDASNSMPLLMERDLISRLTAAKQNMQQPFGDFRFDAVGLPSAAREDIDPFANIWRDDDGGAGR